MKALLFSHILLFFITYACAQQSDYNTKVGFIVNIQNDTLQGILKNHSDLAREISFKEDGQSEFKNYTPNEVKTFHFEGGNYFKSIQLDTANDDRIFLMCLVEGEMSLFKRKDNFYVLKKGHQPVRLDKGDTIIDNIAHRNKRYKGVLIYLTSDCPILHQMMVDASFTDDDFVNSVVAYNKCVSKEGTMVIANEPTRMKVKIGITAATVINQFNYFIKKSPYHKENFEPQVSFMAGVWANLSYNDKIVVQPEVDIIQKRSSAKQSNDGSLNISLTYIQVPVAIYYFFPLRKIRPYLLAGGVAGLKVGSNSYREVVNTYDQSKTKIPLVIDELAVGIRLGTGIPLNEKFRLEYFWEGVKINNFTTLQGIRSSAHCIAVSLILFNNNKYGSMKTVSKGTRNG